MSAFALQTTVSASSINLESYTGSTTAFTELNESARPARYLVVSFEAFAECGTDSWFRLRGGLAGPRHVAARIQFLVVEVLNNTTFKEICSRNRSVDREAVVCWEHQLTSR